MTRAAKSDAQTTFEFIAEHTSDVIVRVDRQGTLIYVSPSIRVYGYEPEDLIGTTGIDLFHPEDRDKVMATTAALLSGRPAPYGNLERRFCKADGDWIWVEGSPHVIHDTAGAPIEMVNVFRDVSYRRVAEANAREQAQLFETAFQHSAIGKCLMGLDGRFLRVNAALCRLTGYSEAELLIMRDADLAHVEDATADRSEYRRLVAGDIDSYSVERRSRRADGTHIWVNLTVAVARNHDGTPKHLVVEVLDMTSQLEAKAALEQSERSYRLIAENTSDIIVVSNMEGQFTYLSPAVRLTGYEPKDLLGRGAAHHTHPDDLAPLMRAFSRLLAPGAGESAVERVRWRGRNGITGGWMWMESSPGLMRDPISGEPTGFIDIIRDVDLQVQHERAVVAAQAEAATAANAMRESEARYRLIAENTSDIICMSDAGARMTYLSPSIRQLGFEPHELVGKTFAGHVHPDDAGRMWGILMRQKQGAPIERIRWRARHKVSEAWMWMESAPTRLWDPVTGEATGFLDVIRDVSGQVAQEEALAAARAEAEAATSVKSQFLANMSHEIRTPLTAVLGYTDILNATPGLDVNALSHVRRIAGAGSALLAIVNDILDFSKLEAGMVEVRPQPTDITGLAEDTLALFEARATEKALVVAVHLAADVPPIVLLDSDRLRQILVNLIGNAVKFTAQGRVTLSVATAEDGKRLHFQVEDTGPGLDPEQCAHLFQRFNQIDGSTARQHGGTGLGLAICKGLAEAMGGTVGVTSTPGVGSIFHLTLPLTITVADSAPTPVADIGSIAGMRVLVVDDNATNRELGRRILEAFGAEVSEAEGGAEALDQLSTAPFDVVLMDLRMPGVDGREALTRLRASVGPNRRTPVLAFTADAEVSTGAGLEVFDGVVRKPIDTVALAASVALAAARADGNWDSTGAVTLRA